MKHFHFLVIAFLLLAAIPASAQNYKSLSDEQLAAHPYWIEMMHDQSVNFYDVQHAFDTYWASRRITRSSGWKPFKRWEYMMSKRILADGSRPSPDREWDAWYDYISKYPDQKSAAGDWTNLGPFYLPSNKGYKGLGRVNSVAFHPTDPNTVFVGAPAGGLWISHDGGATWETHTDQLPSLGVSSVLVDRQNPDIIYIGTGDRDAGDAAGIGVVKSTDGGNTWTLSNTGMENRTVGRMIMHPDDPQVILAATNGGIFITTDGANTWEMTKGGNFSEIVFKPGDPDVVYASAFGNFYRSADGGYNWEQITNGLPGSARAVIGVSPANPDVVYMLQTTSNAFQGLYRSDDAGLSFALMSDSPNIMAWDCNGGEGGQAWYDLDVAVDPADANVLYAGGVDCFKSTDGGITWQISYHWWGDCGVPAVHADLHVLEFNPADGRLYAGNDGGIYWTADGGASWHEISEGLCIGQVYKIGQSATVKDKVMDGYQDNGTSTFMGSGNWVNNLGGDGMECAVDPTDAQYSYGTLYNGEIYRLINNTNSFKIAGEGTYGIDEQGAWVTPFLLDEADPEVMIAGYKNIWRGRHIRSSSPNWAKITNNPGGTANSNFAVLEQSPANPDILYAARENKQFFRCDNVHGQNPQWVQLTPNLPQSLVITDLEADPNDENTVYMTQGTKVFKSTDKGTTWEDISLNLPGVTLNDIAYYINSTGGLYLATDIGIFYKDDFMDEWMLFNDGFPASARVTELEIYYDPATPEGDVIRAGTYGRGLWESDMYHGTPAADFTADQGLVPPGCPVNFTDRSTGVPTGWQWEFEGGQPATSTERNPEGIVFTEPGSHTVSLTITNEFGSDSKVYENLITVDDAILPEVDFTADQQAVCTGAVVTLHDRSLYCPTELTWSFEPNTVEFLNGTNAHSTDPEVRFQEAGSYTVGLAAANSNGQNTATRQDYILAGGYPAPFTESFENGFAEKNWTIVNPDDKITWAVTTPGWTTEGTRAVFMNFYDYYLYYERDDLISPPVSLAGIQDPELNFDYAYAQRYQQTDSLIVMISTDCGETWERIYAGGPDGTGSFATAEPTTNAFNPASAADWCGEGYGAGCVSIDLSPFEGLQDVLFRFQSFNKLGNNLYIDNINIPLWTGTSDNKPGSKPVAVHPNPSNGNVVLDFAQSCTQVKISLKNMQGQTCFEKQIQSVAAGESIPLVFKHLKPGMYIILMTGPALNQSRIIVIE